MTKVARDSRAMRETGRRDKKLESLSLVTIPNLFTSSSRGGIFLARNSWRLWLPPLYGCFATPAFHLPADYRAGVESSRIGLVIDFPLQNLRAR